MMKLGIKLMLSMAVMLAADSLDDDCDPSEAIAVPAIRTVEAPADWWPIVHKAFSPDRYALWAGTHSDGTSNAARQTRIVGIDHANKAALVKAEMLWNGRRHTDFMLLLKVRGTWRVTNKIVTWETVND